MKYYIGDLHLFCENQTRSGRVNYDGRPFDTVEEMHEYILKGWNSRITNADEVWILGDVSMRGKNDKLIALVSQLKGKKILLKGNHDDISDYRYKQLFDAIYEYREITDSFDGKTYKLALFHFPILMWNGQHSGTIMLYAHVHNSVEDDFFQKCIADMNASPELGMRRAGDKKIVAYNVGCMKPYMGYLPRTLKEIMEGAQPIHS